MNDYVIYNDGKTIILKDTDRPICMMDVCVAIRVFKITYIQNKLYIFTMKDRYDDRERNKVILCDALNVDPNKCHFCLLNDAFFITDGIIETFLILKHGLTTHE